MKTPLQKSFQAIAEAHNELELKQTIVAEVGEYFAANRWGVFFMDRLPAIDKKTPEIVKRALSVESNPVLRYVLQRHVAVHDEIILPPGVWQTICPRPDHGHVMAGPIINNGQLVGGIGFTRHRKEPPFTADNLADLSALCLHFSTRLVALRSNLGFEELNSSPLTPRERQIAELVAQGMTNLEIGKALWITENTVKQSLKRMFRKLEVSSRAEMVTKLFASKGSLPQKITTSLP
ncbi:LuxR C-terminal-related transcriptional regulator [Mastigocoleus testarum]|uniref:Transcriptional regulator n=1 Tax=Mastigocoleus testarum BC008 TaxID=371196 RepID=A0A0V7ZUD9_9CYAN|nr:LuxR C-terminal-related transcriptional regulator [Mastigocoleus testarum]KST68240.1 transcriptional regulator [Mastigocoleus testarum BC008]